MGWEMINFYATGEYNGIKFDVYFECQTRRQAEDFAEEMGFKFIGIDEEPIDEDYAMFELALFKPSLHWCIRFYGAWLP